MTPEAAALAPAARDAASPPDLAAREARLVSLVTASGSMLVAFSGGTDSAYLAWLAARLLGPRALAVTADSPSYPDHHRRMALRVAAEFGLRHEVVRTAEFERPEYRANPANRCYYCKSELYASLAAMASARGFAVVADGTNADDRGDYRPGRQAAREFGVRSPLDEAELSKDDVRRLSRRAGLPTWDEPASACLSSRIPYASVITLAKLRAVEEGEAALRALGFRVCRIRHHGDLARVEVDPGDVARAQEPDTLARIAGALAAAGFARVEVDPRGYRTGSLNEGLGRGPKTTA